MKYIYINYSKPLISQTNKYILYIFMAFVILQDMLITKFNIIGIMTIVLNIEVYN